MENNKTIEGNTRSGCAYGEQYMSSACNFFNIQSQNTVTAKWKYLDTATD